MQFKDTSGYTRKLVVLNESGTYYSTSFSEVSSGLYQLSITPSSLAFAEGQYQFTITDGVVTTLAKSDCIWLKETWEETVLINYHNNRIFSSLNSAVGTPDPDFNLRIPAIFFRERFPTTTDQIDLSNSVTIQTMAEIKNQKLLQVKDMPAYMHKKLILVLSFQNVTIGGLEWVKEDSYDPVDPSNPRWPLNKATVWLTRKNYIVRNIL
jgi:regulatory protein YycH of two-component signal transduction system YycFG